MKKRITILIILATLLLTGCQSQDGGMQVDLVRWDDNGLRVGSIHTNGSQVAIWNPDEANARFNTTIGDKNLQNHREDMAETKAVTVKGLSKGNRPTQDITSLMGTTFGPSN